MNNKFTKSASRRDSEQKNEFVRKIRNINLVILCSICFVFFSCSDYNRLLKSTDYNKKYEAAIKYYDDKQYTKALTLLEELVSVYRGTNKAEKIMYYYAYATYSTGDYLLAGYHFENFVKTFPASDKTEECSFMYAYCYYLESPRYSLDQTDTKNAIKELQMFINKYPDSKRKEECNELMSKLRAKLEMKYYEIAKQYYFLEDYKAAVVACGGVLKDFPDTKYREELMFLIVKSNYLYASKSIEKKKIERLKLTVDAFNKFVSYYSETNKYYSEAEGYSLNAKKQLDNLKATP
ncbi:MAG: outer membrane protein assembly factor BamD [Bacteroidetes bacterium]|nr:outer membrane protein assembly factor BamD [Bacteroidota bacterium]